LPVEPPPRKEDKLKQRDQVLSFREFWRWIVEAFQRTGNPRLEAVLNFRAEHLKEQGGLISGELPFLEWKTPPKKGKTEPQPELGAKTDTGDWVPFSKANTLSFEVDGQFIFPDDPHDPLWTDWATAFHREIAVEDGPSDPGEAAQTMPTICLVSGELGRPI